MLFESICNDSTLFSRQTQKKVRMDIPTTVNLSRAIKSLNLEINEELLIQLQKIHRKNLAKYPNESTIIGQAIMHKLYLSDTSKCLKLSNNTT